jgi:hypothetical protein
MDATLVPYEISNSEVTILEGHSSEVQQQFTKFYYHFNFFVCQLMRTTVLSSFLFNVKVTSTNSKQKVHAYLQ